MKKILSVIAIIVGVFLIIGGVAPMVIGAVLKAQVPAASVGIIGGADGPTSIMITGVTGTGCIFLEIVAGVAFVIAGILVGWKKKK